jgi:hypothetical protein
LRKGRLDFGERHLVYAVDEDSTLHIKRQLTIAITASQQRRLFKEDGGLRMERRSRGADVWTVGQKVNNGITALKREKMRVLKSRLVLRQ